MEVLVSVHSYLAYIVLAVLILAVLNAFSGWMGNRSFSMGRDFRLSLYALIFSHIQLLIGLLVYFTSASGFKAIQTLGMGGLNAPARLLALEHPTVNILALVFITIGWSRHKKTEEDKTKFKRIALLYGAGLLLILSRIPWQLWFS